MTVVETGELPPGPLVVADVPVVPLVLEPDAVLPVVPTSTKTTSVGCTESHH